MLSKLSLRFSPKYLPIAWILIGLMVSGSLFDYLTTKQLSDVCVELRILEQEDDRADFSDLLFVPTQGTWCLSVPRMPEELIEFPRLEIWSVPQAANFERGPPTLNLDVA